MKNIKYIMTLALVVVIFAWGCERESNLEPEGNWELSNPSNLSIDGGNDLVLDQTNPDAEVQFSWNEAESSANFIVYYELWIHKADDANANPILKLNSDNGGKETHVAINAKELDEALSMAGFIANEHASIKYTVRAKCLSKFADNQSDVVRVKRFENEIIPDQLFISGAATETGDDITLAIPLKRLNDQNLNPSNKFEIYTKLLAGKSFQFYSSQSLPAHQYGGANGSLVKSGSAMTVNEEGVYRINIDLDNNTYNLFKVDFMGAIGSVFETGWGGDQLLEYQGMGVWKASIEFVAEGGFIFRANKDWVNILKRVVGTSDQIVAESDAASQGVSYEDVTSNVKGLHILTLDLSATGYRYNIEKDPNAPVGGEPIDAPETLYLLGDGAVVDQLNKNGDVFTTTKNVALETGVNYQLNSESNGSGKSYTIDVNLGVTDSPGDVRVSVNANLFDVAGGISVEKNQAYQLEINFAEAKLKWSYYNIFMFHWDEINQKWDDRDEFLMTYEHPYKWYLTANLKANFDMKFFSPWDNDFGSDSPSELTGTMTNKGGSNFRNITTDGSYRVNIELSEDYSTGTYEFVAQ